MQLAPAARSIDLTGRVVARAVDYTDMPGMSYDLVAMHAVGPAQGWVSLDDARAAVLELTAKEGPDNPSAGIFARNGHFEAWSLGLKPHGWDNKSLRPMEAYWGEDEMGYARSKAGASLELVVDNGATYAPSSYDDMREHFRYDN